MLVVRVGLPSRHLGRQLRIDVMLASPRVVRLNPIGFTSPQDSTMVNVPNWRHGST